ncbi:MAG: glycogen/starch synthase [Flavobacteriales bacterium]|jgi:starch synthase|nr:glycogen/starch synthase [Flavobacteriales bacterium]
MSKKRVLYITQEIFPFLPEEGIASSVRRLSQGVQEEDKEIRVFMPRFGVVNERRHQLHEVIRLSGMNLVIDDADHPLIIKVASIPKAKMQVYFIDNEEYFKRKSTCKDMEGNFHGDNDERAMFFCKGVLETVKKLGWKPDIVHCHGWMAGFMPLYLKKMYNNDPHFENVKIVYTAYNQGEGGIFDERLMDKLKFDNFEEEDINVLKSPTIESLNVLGVKWADAVGIGSETINESISSYIKESEKPVLDYQTEETLITAHQDFYNNIIENDEILAN